MCVCVCAQIVCLKNSYYYLREEHISAGARNRERGVVAKVLNCRLEVSELIGWLDFMAYQPL